ncbi:MAG TPA: ABC transporter ATP-binding protein [Clostridia bacterium]|nr:ABC transporter ATP-binding protein [Clostridia bacterium]
MKDVVIKTRDLVKRYGAHVAVDHLNLQVFEGEIYGLLGPNGAGKTTTILMLLGLTEPTSGSVSVAGMNPARDPIGVKRIVGYLPDRVGFYEDMTGRENLLYTAALNGVTGQQAARRVEALLERVGLSDAADRKAGTYSRGMLQRLGLADVLVKGPKVVILDEPTLGIDPEGVRQILDFIVSLSQKEGMTVLLASHLLHQVQEICDRVAIFVKGRIIAEGPVEELSARIFENEPLTLKVRPIPMTDSVVDAISKIPGVSSTKKSGEYLFVTCNDDVRLEISKTVFRLGASLDHLSLEGRDLDEIYRRYFHTEVLST